MAIHAICKPHQPLELLWNMVTAVDDRPNDVGERFEVTLFDSQGVLLEERNNVLQESSRVVDRVNQDGVRLRLTSHCSDSEESNQSIQDINMVLMLRDLEHGLYLPAARRSGQSVTVKAHRKAPFAIYKADDPLGIEPYEFGFLLIDRTGRIVTVHALDPTPTL